MQQQVQQALEFCATLGLGRVIVVVPVPLAPDAVRELRANGGCAGMVLRNPDPEITRDSSSAWLGAFSDDGVTWVLPQSNAPIVFAGPHVLLSRDMILQVARRRQTHLVCQVNGKFCRTALSRLLMWKIGDRVIRTAHTPRTLRLLQRCQRVPALRYLWHKVLRPHQGTAWQRSAMRDKPSPQVAAQWDGVALYRELLRRAAAEPTPGKIPGRVVLVNSGLAAGGAERQLVNTADGLRQSGLDDVHLLLEYIHAVPGLDFYLPLVQSKGIPVSRVERRVALHANGIDTVRPELAEMLALLPSHLLEEILNLVEEFRARRPEVVHAWQDSTAIKCGIAATIAGVPRIVLGSRNVNPSNFAYHQDYMAPAYRALAERDNVVFTNNSEAGAADYCRWLGLSRDRYVVIRNGVDLSVMQAPARSAVLEYRAGLGIPAGAPVVGGVFRFWAEKRPMLWLRTAQAVIDAMPETFFLLIGDGPMRSEMEAFLRRHALKARVLLPGESRDVALPLSAVDMFLLTSQFEGTPNVVLEAQWMGIPVVAMDSGGTREAVGQGTTGFICDDPDPARLAAQVLRVLRDVDMRRNVRTAGPAFVQQFFGVPRMVEETLSAYGLSESGPRRLREQATQSNAVGS